MEVIKAYKTSDGRIFEKKVEAQMHETLLSAVNAFVRWGKAMGDAMVMMKEALNKSGKNN